MKICIFEDSYISEIFPLNMLRHTSQLLCGIYSIKDKIEFILGSNHIISIHCRNYLISLCKEVFHQYQVNNFSDDDYLFLNSRIIYTKSFIDGLFLTINDMQDTLILHKNEIITFHLSKKNIPKLKKIIGKEDGLISLKSLSALRLKQIQIAEINSDEIEELKIINSPADLINYHEEEINSDLKLLLNKNKFYKKKTYHCDLKNPSKIIIEHDCNIDRNVVLDASHGPIYISNNTTIEPFTYIRGPVFIGKNSTVRSGSKLYGPLRIGNWCKVSGEIVSSIFHSYVNKQHLGFIGHSYICEWVNLGAGTTTSNLKNNYSKISIKIGNKTIDSGSIFLGSIIGDLTKTGISTMLNTGSIIGISSNLFGSGFHAKFINSFSWADSNGKMIPYELEKALQTAKISMKRRNVQMSKTYENLLRYYHKNLRK